MVQAQKQAWVRKIFMWNLQHRDKGKKGQKNTMLFSLRNRGADYGKIKAILVNFYCSMVSNGGFSIHPLSL